MPEQLAQRQFSRLMFNKECRLQVWRYILECASNPPVDFTAKEVLVALDHDYPPSVIRTELNAMIALGMLTKIDDSQPLRYRPDTSSPQCLVVWDLGRAIVEHYDSTFGEGVPSEDVQSLGS